MTEKLDETSQALKRIKQLENQNIKFKYLLTAISEITTQDVKGFLNLQNESKSMQAKVELLEKERSELELDLGNILTDYGGEMIHAIQNLERENAELKAKFDHIVKKIKSDTVDLEKLKEEDSELKKMLMQFAADKAGAADDMANAVNSSNAKKTENLQGQKTFLGTESESENILMGVSGEESASKLPEEAIHENASQEKPDIGGPEI